MRIRVAIYSMLILLIVAANNVLAETMKIETIQDYALRTYGEQGLMKSGTPAIMRLLKDQSETAQAYKAAFPEASRPEMNAFADSKEGHFRVHYDTSGYDAPDLTDADKNNIPDYVDSTLVYLEYAWKLIVLDLQYGSPVLDGTLGGEPKDMVDCYIKELSHSSSPLYGMTMPDYAFGGTTSSYLEIDNGFDEPVYYTKGYNALKITTAHEFFHTIHYRYYGAWDSLWWMEQTAVWMEDRAWDNVNDYINYLGYIFTDRNTPLDNSGGSFMYGAAVFAFYIAKQHGDSMIRSIWNKIQASQNGSIENMNSVLPDGLSPAMSDLAVWMYFTNYRATGDTFFHDAAIINNMVKPDISITETSAIDSMTFHHYTFKYVDITPKEGLAYGDSLKITYLNRDSGQWMRKVILYSSPTNYEIMSFTGDSGVIQVPRPFEKAVLVITNTSKLNKNYRLAFSVDITSTKGVAKDALPAAFALEGIFPNPFNNATAIRYSIGNNEHVSLRIFDLRGAVVATLADGFPGTGKHTVQFDASGIASGVYFAVLESNGVVKSQKMTLLK